MLEQFQTGVSAMSSSAPAMSSSALCEVVQFEAGESRVEGQPGADIKAGIQRTGGLLFLGMKK